MRHLRTALPVVSATLALVLASAACQDSNDVTSVKVTVTAANVSGAWAGTYTANDPGKCASSSASASFTQDGRTVRGILKTSNCGVAGSFKGTVDESGTLLGLIDMPGCVGGGVTGTMVGTELHLALGDMTKPLITGDQVIMTGGYVTLRR